MSEDWAAKIAALAAAAAGAPEAGARIEARLRAELGGQRVRIEQKAPITVEMVEAGLRRGLPVSKVAATMGVHRSTLYKLIGKSRAERKARA